MVARFLCALVSLAFYLAALGCWLIGLGGIILQFTAEGFQLSLVGITVVFFILSVMLATCGSEAWRASRYRYSY